MNIAQLHVSGLFFWCVLISTILLFFGVEIAHAIIHEEASQSTTGGQNKS